MDAILDPPPLRAAAASKAPWLLYAHRAGIWMMIAGVLFGALITGLNLRRWVFDLTQPIRFVDDDSRGFYWGMLAGGPEGYLNQYDKMDPQVPEWQDARWVPWLDYGPLRLLVMRQWASHEIDVAKKAGQPLDDIPNLDVWRREYDFNKPVMLFNTVLELFSCVCAFFLARLWVIRGSPPNARGHFLGVWQGIVAALLLWFSADTIISAHAWFQWDTWAVPWYLCACLLASLDWWLTAGICVAIGICFKGQMMSIAPIFIIWPLVQGKPVAAVRWCIGVLLGFAAITSGWMLTYLPPAALAQARAVQDNMTVADYPADLFAIHRLLDLPAAIWIGEMLLMAAAVPWLLRILRPPPESLPPGTPPPTRWRAILNSPWLWTIAAIIVLMAVTIWPWFLRPNRPGWLVGILASAALAAAALFLPRRALPYTLAAIAAIGLHSCIWLFHGSAAWWDCSIHYGSIHWPYLVTGPASNIPATFELRFGWPEPVDQIAFTMPAIAGHWPSIFARNDWWPAADMDVTAKMAFNTIYAVALLLSGIAIGLQARRNDRRMLVALVTPWIMFFLFPVQIQERYLLYASGAAACCIGNSVGTALLGFALTILSAIMHMIRLLDWHSADLDAFGQNLSNAFPHLFSPQSGQTMLQYLQAMHPDMVWAVLVIGLAFLYLSFLPSPKRRND